jgi:hypothetical protein
MLARAAPLRLGQIRNWRLEALARFGSTQQRAGTKGRLILLAEQGIAKQGIAQRLTITRPTLVAVGFAFAERRIGVIAGPERRKRSAKVLTPELVGKTGVHLRKKRGNNMAEKKLTITLTDDQQKQIKDATGKSITELNIDLDSTGDLTDLELEQVAGGFHIYTKIN